MTEEEKSDLLARAEYQVRDLIIEVNERYDKLSPGELGRPDRKFSQEQDTYPSSPAYTFMEFAGPVFELGGYGDMTLVDPYSLKRLWVGDAFDCHEPGHEVQCTCVNAIYRAMRRVIDIAEAIGFPAETEGQKCLRHSSM